MYKKKFSFHIISFVFKALCGLIIAAVVGVLLWRVFSSGDPKSLKPLIINDQICKAYEENDGSLTLFEQDFDEITRADHNSGYFGITRAVFIKEADQVQLIFRYNNSTLQKVKEDKGLSEVPDRDDNFIDVTLVVVYDTTPEDKSDNSDDSQTIKRVRYHASGEPLSEQKNLYNFRKYVFDGIDTDSNVIAVYADFYYVGDIDYESDSYGTLRIYHVDQKCNEVTLSKADKENIEACLEKN